MSGKLLLSDLLNQSKFEWGTHIKDATGSLWESDSVIQVIAREGYCEEKPAYAFYIWGDEAPKSGYFFIYGEQVEDWVHEIFKHAVGLVHPGTRTWEKLFNKILQDQAEAEGTYIEQWNTPPRGSRPSKKPTATNSQSSKTHRPLELR